MKITFVSQCQKKAQSRTRRVLDSFADRIGDGTWQTLITQEGLIAVKKLLRKTASKNTAVSCHWIRSRSTTELLWIVGNKNKFNQQGIVPVNFTNADIGSAESAWHLIEPVSILTGIAGLFHDVGKANVLFQKKLEKETKGVNYEPYRHEWVSLRIFQAFVGSLSDREWINKLATVNGNVEQQVISALTNDPEATLPNPLLSLPPVAKTVAWLIVSHHKLPVSSEDNRAPIENIDRWEESFSVSWNSFKYKEEKDPEVLRKNWCFPNGTPISSVAWQIQARVKAKAALNCTTLFEESRWLEQRFLAHTARLSLMLADHYYSSLCSGKSKDEWQDPNYHCFANTDKNGDKKQKLDEHNIGVAINATAIARELPSLRADLPNLENDKILKKSVAEKHQKYFGWQDKACKLALSLTEDSRKFGFFGINMASTGSGKTRANVRIMHALSGQQPCRLSVALGLRTLTLQTGDVLKKDLGIHDDEIAVLVGSHAIKQLHAIAHREQQVEDAFEKKGSESETPLIDVNTSIKHDLGEYSGRFAKWLKHNDKLLRLLQAPVLVSTIDYLIPATEGVRRGRQIAPMLRLLTSDLVLDEPDDFGLEDMPALCRLVNWAGMLGSRVLLSSASIPPSLACALFDAYKAGRKYFVEVNIADECSDLICCAWFDENINAVTAKINSFSVFQQTHNDFVTQRITELKQQNRNLVKGKLVSPAENISDKPVLILAETIHNSLHQLHQDHSIKHSSGKSVSIGLVRMANIKPLVAVAEQLFKMKPAINYRLHFCVYHSQFPMILRSYIETRLDRALSRKKQKQWWEKSGLKEKIEDSDEEHHIFIVLATPVAEVGRDHDYDWAIAEPSSMRSLIQLAGRVQRHRKIEPSTENFHIISLNYRGLKADCKPVFCKPGFETKKTAYYSADLRDLLDAQSYSSISAIPRIQQPQEIERSSDKFTDFNQLEHWAQHICLFGKNGEPEHASLWWKWDVSWCAEMQTMQPFRKSQAKDIFCLSYNERTQRLIWQEKDIRVSPPEIANTNKIISAKSIKMTNGNAAWFDMDIRKIVSQYGEELKISEEKVWQCYTEVTLDKASNGRQREWQFSEIFGIYERLEES